MSRENEELIPRWYVVHTYSGYENKVKTDLEKTVKNRELEDFFFDIIVPMEEQIEIKDGKRKTNLKKVFPGYVLIKMIVTEETWYIVINTRGVTGFVGSGTDPIPLTEEEITVKGRMIGGCLDILTELFGTRFDKTKDFLINCLLFFLIK